MARTDKPPRFEVNYERLDLYERLVEERGTPDIEPLDYWTFEEFDELEEAQKFAEEQSGAVEIFERTNFRWEWPTWDWDTKQVDPASTGNE